MCFPSTKKYSFVNLNILDLTLTWLPSKVRLDDVIVSNDRHYLCLRSNLPRSFLWTHYSASTCCTEDPTLQKKKFIPGFDSSYGAGHDITSDCHVQSSVIMARLIHGIFTNPQLYGFKVMQLTLFTAEFILSSYQVNDNKMKKVVKIVPNVQTCVHSKECKTGA